MIGIGRVLEVRAAELGDNEIHALVAVAAMAVAGVGQAAEHGLVDLHPAGCLRPVGRDRALGALGRDGARPVRDQEPDQHLQRQRFRCGRLLAGEGQEQKIRHCPLAEAFIAGNPPQAAMPVMLGGNRCADHHAIEPQIPRQRLARSGARCACASAGPRRSWWRSPPGSHRATAALRGFRAISGTRICRRAAPRRRAWPRGADRRIRRAWRETARGCEDRSLRRRDRNSRRGRPGVPNARTGQ